MNAPHYTDDEVTVWHGDCLDVLRSMPGASVDSVVTDPPYGLEFMGKEWDRLGDIGKAKNRGIGGIASKGMTLPESYNADVNVKCANCDRWRKDHAARRCTCASPTFPNVKAHQARTMQTWHEEWATEALRVLKPGGHMLAFGGTRTWHRLVCAIEDAGFEIRDSIAWMYGSGFPKSLNLTDVDGERTGWGTALKPAHEPIVVARKPLAGTVATNVLAHGTGALNIDGCRIAGEPWKAHEATGLGRVKFFTEGETPVIEKSPHDAGRWPANVVLDESQAAVLDEQSGVLTSGANPTRRGSDKSRDAYGEFAGQEECVAPRGADSGGASRFFYVAKAPQAERITVNGVAHPTVKPLALMRWLIRLVTPPGGTVLEPFAGSGTTVEACIAEGFTCVAIERDESYLPLISARILRRGVITPDPVRVKTEPVPDQLSWDMFEGVAE